MENYLTSGWMDYATCGTSKVGGFAKPKALYCNATEYNQKSEKFRVSYLVHEAQHYADYKKFKNLDSFALEYRAKLAEIIASRRTTRKLISLFQSQSSKKRHSYHSYATHKIIENLGSSVKMESIIIRKKAELLLLSDSENRKRTGFKSL
jgi:predicted SprT family Zn-dependent metalloprotease